MRMDAKTNETPGKRPVMHTRTNRDWWPDQLVLTSLHQNSPLSNSMGEALDYGRVQDARPQGVEERSLRADDGLAEVVACRLRPLWRTVHPHGVAQRGHLPHH